MADVQVMTTGVRYWPGDSFQHTKYICCYGQKVLVNFFSLTVAPAIIHIAGLY